MAGPVRVSTSATIDMPGRIRAYDLTMSDGSRRAAVGIAVSRRCDLLVAVAQGSGAARQVQRVALDFLDRRDMAGWMVAAMNGYQATGAGSK